MYFSHRLEISTHLFEDLAFCKSFSSNFLLLLRLNQVCSQNLHVKFPSPYFWDFHQHQTCRIPFFFFFGTYGFFHSVWIIQMNSNGLVFGDTTECTVYTFTQTHSYTSIYKLYVCLHKIQPL